MRRRQVTIQGPVGKVRTIVKRLLSHRGNHLGWGVRLEETDEQGLRHVLVERKFFVLGPGEAVGMAIDRAFDQGLFLGRDPKAYGRLKEAVLLKVLPKVAIPEAATEVVETFQKSEGDRADS